MSFSYVPIESVDVFDPATFSAEHKCAIRHSTDQVYFLLSRRGNGMETHVGGVGREGRRAVRGVCVEFLAWVPEQYPWCEMILAPVLNRSVYNMCMKIGFKDLGKQPFKGAFTNLMIYKYPGE